MENYQPHKNLYCCYLHILCAFSTATSVSLQSVWLKFYLWDQKPAAPEHWAPFWWGIVQEYSQILDRNFVVSFDIVSDYILCSQFVAKSYWFFLNLIFSRWKRKKTTSCGLKGWHGNSEILQNISGGFSKGKYETTGLRTKPASQLTKPKKQ